MKSALTVQFLVSLFLLISPLSLFANECSTIFFSTQQLFKQEFERILADQSEIESKLENVKGSYSQLEKYRKNVFVPSVLTLLNKNGIEASYYGYDMTSFDISPTGDHSLNKIAKRYAPYGIRLAVTKRIWDLEALGAFDAKRIHIDKSTLYSGKLSFVIAHEMTHALDYNKALSDPDSFEALFYTNLSAFKNPDQRIPTFTGNHYSDYFSLDEILAHRQSALWFFRNLRSQKISPQQRSLYTEEIRSHAERIYEFISSFLLNAKTFQEHIRVGAFELYKTHPREDAIAQELIMVLRQPKTLQEKWKAEKHFNYDSSLKMDLIVTSPEKSRTRIEDSLVFSKRLYEITTVLASLEKEALHLQYEASPPKGEFNLERAEKAFASFNLKLRSIKREYRK